MTRQDSRRGPGARLRHAWARASRRRPGVRPLLLIATVVPLAACSSLGPELGSLDGAPTAGPGLVALAPSIDPAAGTSELVGSDSDGARIAQLYRPPPPPSTAALDQDRMTIQGVAVYEDAPAGSGYDVTYVDAGDPLEDFNRRVFWASNAIDEVVIEPVARTYRHLFPYHARVAVRNFASNLESPVTLANDLMQGEWERAHVTVSRFVINSTIGFAGLHDAAAEMGYEGHREDFDQTLALYGWHSGPYIVVPLIGPSTPRHLVGRVVDTLFHPLTWVLAGEPTAVVLAERAAQGIIAREEVLDTIAATRATSADYYAAIQSFYRQNRTSEINNGQLVNSGGQGHAGGGVALDEDLDFNF